MLKAFFLYFIAIKSIVKRVLVHAVTQMIILSIYEFNFLAEGFKLKLCQHCDQSIVIIKILQIQSRFFYVFNSIAKFAIQQLRFFLIFYHHRFFLTKLHVTHVIPIKLKLCFYLILIEVRPPIHQFI